MSCRLLKAIRHEDILWWFETRTTDTQWRHKSKKSENLGRCGGQNMLWPYLKIWEWELIFGRAVKAISSIGVRSPWPYISILSINFSFLLKQRGQLGFVSSFGNYFNPIQTRGAYYAQHIGKSQPILKPFCKVCSTSFLEA